MSIPAKRRPSRSAVIPVVAGPQWGRRRGRRGGGGGGPAPAGGWAGGGGRGGGRVGAGRRQPASADWPGTVRRAVVVRTYGRGDAPQRAHRRGGVVDAGFRRRVASAAGQCGRRRGWCGDGSACSTRVVAGGWPRC